MVPQYVIDRGYYITGSTVNTTGETDMDPETDEKIAQMESSLRVEQQRLEKLWDAYEQKETMISSLQ